MTLLSFSKFKGALLSVGLLLATTAMAQDVKIYAGSTEGTSANNSALSGAKFSRPDGIVFDSKGNAFITDNGNNLLIGVLSSKYYVRGGNTAGGFVEGGGAGVSRFSGPTIIELGVNDTMFFVDNINEAIRKVGAFVGTGQSQYISLLTGGGPGNLNSTGVSGYAEGKKDAALFSNITGLAANGSGSYLYVSDQGNEVIRRISLSGPTYGTSTLYAGKPGEEGTTDGALLTARFSNLGDMLFSGSTLYVVDGASVRTIAGNTVSTVIPSSALPGNISAMAKSGTNLFLSFGTDVMVYSLTSKQLRPFTGMANEPGDEVGTLAAARYNNITDLKVSADGKLLYIVDSENHKIKTANIESVVGINGTAAASTLQFYPNPASSTISFQVTSPILATQCTSIDGRVVSLPAPSIRNINSATFDVAGLTPGYYIITVSTTNGTFSGKVIIAE